MFCKFGLEWGFLSAVGVLILIRFLVSGDTAKRVWPCHPYADGTRGDSWCLGTRPNEFDRATLWLTGERRFLVFGRATLLFMWWIRASCEWSYVARIDFFVYVCVSHGDKGCKT
jgi:hypothetical protein